MQSCKFGTAVYESSHSVSTFLDLLKQCKQLISDETRACLIQGTGEEINMHTELTHKCGSFNPARFGCKMLYTSVNNTICAVVHMPTLCCINRFTWSSLGEKGPIFDPHCDQKGILSSRLIWKQWHHSCRSLCQWASFSLNGEKM